MPRVDAHTATPAETAWDNALLANPHAVADKRARVRRMFAAIAPSYDLNNRLHSFWQDQRWRRKATRLAQLKPTDRVVDVACGTGDLTLIFAAGIGLLNGAAGHRPMRGQVLGVDFTYDMLPFAVGKAGRLDNDVAQQDPRVSDPWCGIAQFVNGDAQALPLPDACCDVVSIAFGLRNVQDPAAALREFRRVLRPGGRVIVLEFSRPTNRLIGWFNDVYCGRIMPLTATWISGDRSGAYKYLPTSVRTFADRDHVMQMMRDAGFANVEAFPMTFGVAVCYRGGVE